MPHRSLACGRDRSASELAAYDNLAQTDSLPNRANYFQSAFNIITRRIPPRRASAGLPMGVKRPNFSGLTEIMHRKPRTTAEEHSPRPRRASHRPPLRFTDLPALRLTGLPPSPRLWWTRLASGVRPPVVGPVADRAPGQRPGLQHSAVAKAMADTSAILPPSFPDHRPSGLPTFRPPVLWLSDLPTVRPSAVPRWNVSGSVIRCHDPLT